MAVAILGAMRTIAERQGLTRLVAPVRPSWKERYPLAPIERYVTWRRDDGELLDPWMRVHERLGARVSRPLPRSLLITGTVAEWDRVDRTGLPRVRRLRLPRGPRPAERRRGLRHRHLLGAERLDGPPRHPGVARQRRTSISWSTGKARALTTAAASLASQSGRITQTRMFSASRRATSRPRCRRRRRASVPVSRPTGRKPGSRSVVCRRTACAGPSCARVARPRRPWRPT